MDRNEVTLVGRLPEAVRIRSLQSGSALGSWRVIVRRQRRGRGTRVDTIPCVSFEPEVTVAVAEWLPDDTVEVVGSLRRRWWGNDGVRSSGYEVEVRSAKRLQRAGGTAPGDDEQAPDPTPPRPVRSLLPGDGPAGQEGGEAEDELRPVHCAEPISAPAESRHASAPRGVKVPPPRDG